VAVSLLAMLVLMVLVAGGVGSALLFSYFRRQSGRLEGGMDREVLARVLEDLDQLSNRLNRVEEELDFFKELRRPEEHPRLGAADQGEA
jgi:hypothetical protein